MVGAVGPQNMMPQPEAGPGKRAMAVGQQAKLAVAEAKAAGGELPRNAQGMAASAIAKGADAASIFAGLTAPDAPIDDSATGGVDAGGDAVAPDDTVTTPPIVSDPPPEPDAAETATDAATDAGVTAPQPEGSTGIVVDSAGIALDLLDGQTETAG